ncbi:hypothetical protein JG687_00007635 [Phytophthora cactorum]|uniref:Uncharacterized protein n=1 Tax=Phytophthora cactorum TaxID=29920 RepID=A0A8T1UJN1_9STRA|nr:hypothetical protein JG687_00007635 [Phytophthora cactorum]
MAIDEIIAEIASLVYRTARGQVYEVCEIEWNEFMESEAPESKRGKMEWIDGEIVLVELGTTEYGIFVGTLASYFFLTTMMFARTIDLIWATVRLPNLPSGWRWCQWQTLKVEVGHLRQWGNDRGQLDWKANEWATIPGVNYILYVAVEDHMASATNKLYTVVRTNQRLPVQNPIPIEAPQTVVKFDSRLLLGLTPRAQLPTRPPFPVHAILQNTQQVFLY